MEQGQRPVLQKECEAYRFGAGKIHYSSFYVVICFEFGNCRVQVRSSIITGDIPLLLSRTVLGKLGMVFDVGSGTADFNKLGLHGFQMLCTSSGHPAIPIVPAKTDSAAPLLEAEDLRLQPREQYTSVCAVACRTPTVPQLTGVYHEKKLDPSVKDMLSQDRLQRDMFMTWWGQTSYDRDFWIETPATWVRVHVVPRRAMFNPSTWRTSSTILKDMLLATLGYTRTTESISCCSGKWLETAVDLWEHERGADQSFPLLWVGRTVLHKVRPLESHTPSADLGDGCLGAAVRGEEEDDQQHDEAGAPPRSDEVGNDGASFLDGDRVEGGDPRAPGADRQERRGQADEEDQLTHPRGAEGEGRGAERAAARPGEQGTYPQAHPGLPQHAGQHFDDDRSLEGERVSRNSPELRRVGSDGDLEVGQQPPGPHPLCPLVPAQATRGGQHNDATADQGVHGKGEPQAYAQEGQQRDQGEGRQHGVPAQPGGVGGDRGAGAQASPPQGQGPQQRAVRFAPAHEESIHRESVNGVKCCGWVCEGDVIEEEAFVHGHYNQTLNYVSEHHEHYEHYDHSRGARHRAAPKNYERYGDGTFDWQDYSFENCQRLLEDVTEKDGKYRFRAIHLDEEDTKDQAYVTYGMFTHGGVHGVTRASKEQAAVTRYLNYFGRVHLGNSATWTSVSVTSDVGTEVHRDGNNLKETRNYSCTFGQTEGGQLWLEDTNVDESQANGGQLIWKKDRTGAWVPGRTHDTYHKFVEFDPFHRHCSLPWTGRRWCVTFHTVRGAIQVGPEIKKFLRNSGFPLPSAHSRSTKSSGERKQPTKTARNGIFNNAGKISVLMTTLMTAAMSWVGECTGPTVEWDPIVMMEIGGYEGTIEATELGKAVIEPLSWSDYLNPDTQENAHYFVTAASPKELRIHLEKMPERVVEKVCGLIEGQINGGEEVVLRGGDPKPYTIRFADYLQYESLEEDDATVVFGEVKSGATPLKGGERPFQVCAVQAEVEPEAKPVKYDGSGITFESGVQPIVQSSLRRLHQNLGHPRSEDLCRHLRLAGCEPHIIKAAKGLKCATCNATKSAQISPPSTLPRLLDFNSCVGIDIMYVHDANDCRTHSLPWWTGLRPTKL